MSGRMEGGCQCGRVRYAVELAGDDAYLCHCRMCQKATGGVAAAFVNVPDARHVAVVLIHGQLRDRR